jgi:hypothetical protein
MKSIVVLVLLALVMVVLTEPTRNFLFDSSYTALLVTVENQKLVLSTTLYVNHVNKQIRTDNVDASGNKYTVIADYLTGKHWLIRESSTNPICTHTLVSNWTFKPFTFDFFQHARYVGADSVDGKPARKWENVLSFNGSGLDTYYMDSATSQPLRTVSMTKQKHTTIRIISTETPASSIFTPSLAVQGTCIAAKEVPNPLVPVRF